MSVMAYIHPTSVLNCKDAHTACYRTIDHIILIMKVNYSEQVTISDVHGLQLHFISFTRLLTVFLCMLIQSQILLMFQKESCLTICQRQ